MCMNNVIDMVMDEDYGNIDKLVAIHDGIEEFEDDEPVEDSEEDPLLSHILDGVISYEEERNRNYLYDTPAPIILPQVRIIYSNFIPQTLTPSPQSDYQQSEYSRKRTMKQTDGNDSLKPNEMEHIKPPTAKRTKKSKESIEHSNRTCYQCGTNSTPQWRIFKKMVENDEDKLMLCNACHRYASIHGLEKKRPEKLVKRKVQTRARIHI